MNWIVRYEFAGTTGSVKCATRAEAEVESVRLRDHFHGIALVWIEEFGRS